MDWITLRRDEIESDAMPPVCIHCGEPAALRHNKTFEWYPEWVTWLLLAGYVPGLIALAFCTRKQRVSMPVCAAHHPETKLPPRPLRWPALLGWLLVPLACAAAGLVGALLWTLPPRSDPSAALARRIELEGEEARLKAEIRGLGFDPDTAQDTKDLFAKDFAKESGVKDGPAPKADPERERGVEKARQAALAGRALADVRHRLGRVGADLTNADFERKQAERDSAATREWLLTVTATGGFLVGALIVLLVWLAGASGVPPAPRRVRPKPIQVQEISGDGISLVGVSAGFVRAMMEQRKGHTPDTIRPAPPPPA